MQKTKQVFPHRDGQLLDLRTLKKIVANLRLHPSHKELLSLLSGLDRDLHFYPLDERSKVIEQIKEATANWSINDLAHRAPASPIVASISYEKLYKLSPLREQDITELAAFSTLAPHLDDEIVVDYCTSRGKLTMNVNTPSLTEDTAKRALRAIIYLYSAGLLDENKALLTLIVKILAIIPSMRKAHSLFDAMQSTDEEAFYAAARTFGIASNTQEEKYTETLQHIPIAWRIDRVIKKGATIVNQNLFPTLTKNSTGMIQPLFPFEKMHSGEVREIYSYTVSKWLPAETPGPSNYFSLHSFAKAKSRMPSKNAIATVKRFTENEISERFGKILNDLNKYKHGPTEVADVMPRIQRHQEDARPITAAMVLKGKSTPIVNPKAVSHQLIKAFQAYPDIVFLIHNTRLLNETQSQLISLSKQFHTPYCIMGTQELATLFEAYDVLNI